MNPGATDAAPTDAAPGGAERTGTEDTGAPGPGTERSDGGGGPWAAPRWPAGRSGLTLEEGARLAGAHCWVERRLFETLGAWVAGVGDPHAKLMLDRHSQHHAWRAAQWADRLPVLDRVDRNALIRPPSASWRALVEDLATADTPVARLAGAYRVALPRQLSAYRAHRAVAGPVADGAALRTLSLVEPDLTADWAEGEAALQRLLDTPDAVDTAAGRVAALERLLIDSGTGR